MPKRYEEQTRQRLAQVVAEGVSLRAAARRVGVSPSTAWRWQDTERERRNRDEALRWAREHANWVAKRQREYRKQGGQR